MTSEISPEDAHELDRFLTASVEHLERLTELPAGELQPAIQAYVDSVDAATRKLRAEVRAVLEDERDRLPRQ